MTSNKHLYLKIAEEVEAIIMTGKLKPHDPVPSEGELASRYGVSRMTTKLALELLAKKGLVYRLPRRGTFRAEYPVAEMTDEAASFSTDGGKTRKMAFVVSNLDYYTSKIASGIEEEAGKHNFNLIVKLSKDADDEDACLRQLRQDGVDCIVLFPRARNAYSEQVKWMKMDRYPIVIVDRVFRELAIDCVSHDHAQGTRRMLDHLIAKGHTEIGYVTNQISGISSREERYQSYIQGLVEHKIPLKSQYIHIIEKANDLTNYSNEDLMLDRFLLDNPKMTALMCGDDYLAAAVFYSALRVNRPVPEQLSVSGFSDIQLATMLPLPLTTVRQPARELGREAVKLLIRRIDNPDEEYLQVKISTQIIERNTVSSLHDKT